MLKLAFIAIGGAIGTAFRYVISGVDFKFSNGVFPASTFVVNIAGSLIIGFLWVMFEKVDVSSTLRMFVFVGILGGFTTFSTFSLENLHLLRDGEFKIAFLNILLTNLLGIAFVFVGFAAAKFFSSLVKSL